VITPVPPAKTPVNVALDPARMVDGFAVKLAMVGTGGVELTEPPQPIKPPKHTLSATAPARAATIRFIGIPGYIKIRRFFFPDIIRSATERLCIL
jgi:hypothetical protein